MEVPAEPSDPEREEMAKKLYVGNLPYSATEEELTRRSAPSTTPASKGVLCGSTRPDHVRVVAGAAVGVAVAAVAAVVAAGAGRSVSGISK
jgi:hypothetical protein